MMPFADYERALNDAFQEYHNEDRTVYLKSGRVLSGIIHVGGSIMVIEDPTGEPEYQTVFKDEVAKLV